MPIETEMPRYRSHKIVRALKIAEVHHDSNNLGAVIFPVEEGFPSFQVDKEYVMKHDPKADGYYIIYDDGYKSWSPAEAFEAGYTRI